MKVSARNNLQIYTVRLIIVVLFLLLLALLYFFMRLTEPKVAAKKLDGYKFIKAIFGPPGDRFNRPHDIAADKDFNFYVTDSANGRVVVFDKQGEYIRTVGNRPGTNNIKEGSKDGSLINPIGVSVSEDGEIYVAERSLNKVVVYKNNGSYLRSWRVSMPIKPFVFKDYVFLTTYGPLFVFDKKGSPIYKLGKRGSGTEDFDFPNGMAVDSQNKYLIIADSNNNRIKVHTLDSGIVKEIDGKKSAGISDGTLKYQLPSGLCFDENGLLYCVDTLGFNIKVFSIIKGNLKQIEQFGKYGTEDGNFYYPSGIAYLGDRRFAIADESANRVQMVQIPLTSKMKKFLDKRAPNQDQNNQVLVK